METHRIEAERKDDAVPPIRPARPTLPFRHRIGTAWRRFWADLCSQFSRDPLERCRWVHFGASFQNVSEKSKDRLARAGEEEAIFLLREKGYTVLHRNILLPEGEIDVVARKGRLLVFIEVKTRRQGDPWNAVTEAKQRRQCAMAGRFMSLCRIRDVPVRFDIISIVWPEDASPKIEHWENAFQPNDLYRSA